MSRWRRAIYILITRLLTLFLEKPRPTPSSTNFTLPNLIFDLQTSATYPLVTNYSFATQAESLKLQGVKETFQISSARWIIIFDEFSNVFFFYFENLASDERSFCELCDIIYLKKDSSFFLEVFSFFLYHYIKNNVWVFISR